MRLLSGGLPDAGEPPDLLTVPLGSIPPSAHFLVLPLHHDVIGPQHTLDTSPHPPLTHSEYHYLDFTELLESVNLYI